MNILFALIPLALVLLGFAVWAFFWAVKSGQFDDLDTPPLRILLDNEDDPAQNASLRGLRGVSLELAIGKGAYRTPRAVL